MLKLIDDEQYFVFIDSSSKDESCASHEVGFLFFFFLLAHYLVNFGIPPRKWGLTPTFIFGLVELTCNKRLNNCISRHCKQTDENVNKLVLGF